MKGSSLSRFLARRVDAVRILFLLGLNCDFPTILRMIQTGRAAVSQSGLKRLCAPGLNCYSCPSAVMSCPVGALQAWIGGSAERRVLGERISWTGLYVMGFVVALGAFAGRLWCGLACPFGAAQEWLSRTLGGGRNAALPRCARYLKYLVAAVLVLIMPAILVDGISIGPAFCKFLCPSGTLFGGIPLVAADPRLREALSWVSLVKASALALVIGMLFVTRRFFCKTLCPLGAIWGLLNRVGVVGISADPGRCTGCGACRDACPMHLDPLRETDSPECVRCLGCIRACPEEALRLGTRGRAR